MDDKIRQVLAELVSRYGKDIALDPRRLRALLMDRYGRAATEINLLVWACEIGVTRQLLAENQLPLDVLFPRLVEHYEKMGALRYEEASWAIATWLFSLGIIFNQNLSKIENTLQEKYQEIHTFFRLYSPFPAEVPTIHVGQGDYSSLQEAVKAAAPGSRIKIHTGVYKENVVINKPLEIIGIGSIDETVIEVNRGLQIVTEHVILRNLTILGKNSPGIQITGNNIRLIAANCMITTGINQHIGVDLKLNGGNKVYMFKSTIVGGLAVNSTMDDLLLEDCNISYLLVDQGGTSILKNCTIIRKTDGEGISIRNGGKVFFSNCNISNMKGAVILLQNSGSATFSNCEINHLNHPYSLAYIDPGVKISEEGIGTFENCRIHNNRNAVEVGYGGNGELFGCKLNSNYGVGVYVHHQSKAVIDGCDVTNNQRGPWIIEKDCLVQQRDNKI